MSRFAKMRKPPPLTPEAIAGLRERLGARAIVLVGLMGCGKSSVGKRLAARLDVPFVDADEEIELAAGKSIPEIFAEHGEPHFRDGERRVIARLLDGQQKVLATGGGAFMNAQTRSNVGRDGVSIWLKAELPILMRRVLRRSNRPLLKAADPEAVMRELMAARYPVYAEAAITIQSREVPHDVIVDGILAALDAHLPPLAGAHVAPADPAEGSAQAAGAGSQDRPDRDHPACADQAGAAQTGTLTRAED